MKRMFYYAGAFNQPLNNRDVSAVTKMDGVFAGARAFNQPLNDWDISTIGNMYATFAVTSAFNQPLNDCDPLDMWNLSNLNDVKTMFDRAKTFNQCLYWGKYDFIYNHTFQYSGCPYKTAQDGTWQCREDCFTNAPTASPTIRRTFSAHKIVRAEVQNKSAEVFTLEPISFKTYFEVKDDSNIAMELFSDVPLGKPCTDGTALNTSHYNATSFRMEDYYVTGFKDVKCSNNGQTRALFSDSVQDLLTYLLDMSKTRDKDEIAVGSTADGFVSIRESNFSCSGEVTLPHTPSGRRLMRGFSLFQDDINRLLQEETNVGSFASTVALNTEDVNRLTGSASMGRGDVVALGLSVLLATM
eukprot:jgi/Psemu1/44848/gm1.44848_g